MEALLTNAESEENEENEIIVNYVNIHYIKNQ
jgi:hypothetical protein